MALAGMRYLAILDESAIEDVLAAWQAAHPCPGVLALLPEAEKEAVTGLQAACARSRKSPPACAHLGDSTEATLFLLFDAMLLKPHRGAILEHGYGAPPRMRLATSTEGNRIIQAVVDACLRLFREKGFRFG